MKIPVYFMHCRAFLNRNAASVEFNFNVHTHARRFNVCCVRACVHVCVCVCVCVCARACVSDMLAMVSTYSSLLPLPCSSGRAWPEPRPHARPDSGEEVDHLLLSCTGELPAEGGS